MYGVLLALVLHTRDDEAADALADAQVKVEQFSLRKSISG